MVDTIADPYEKFKIKAYDNWDLFLHERQYPYIGRCYAAATRPDADLVTDMTSEETYELFNLIVPQWDQAISELFQHNRPNVACLGNEWNHLHWHLIPRYRSPREFQGVIFEDPNPTGNYAPYPKKELSLETLTVIKKEIELRIPR